MKNHENALGLLIDWLMEAPDHDMQDRWAQVKLLLERETGLELKADPWEAAKQLRKNPTARASGREVHAAGEAFILLTARNTKRRMAVNPRHISTLAEDRSGDTKKTILYYAGGVDVLIEESLDDVCRTLNQAGCHILTVLYEEVASLEDEEGKEEGKDE